MLQPRCCVLWLLGLPLALAGSCTRCPPPRTPTSQRSATAAATAPVHAPGLAWAPGPGEGRAYGPLRILLPDGEVHVSLQDAAELPAVIENNSNAIYYLPLDDGGCDGYVVHIIIDNAQPHQPLYTERGRFANTGMNSMGRAGRSLQPHEKMEAPVYLRRYFVLVAGQRYKIQLEWFGATTAKAPWEPRMLSRVATIVVDP